jgi:acetyl esterase/lipase
MLSFTPQEIEPSIAFYRDKLARQPRVDFNKRWVVQLVRPLFYLAYLDRRALKKHRVKAERRTLHVGERPIRVRIIRSPDPPRGVIVDIHGGGWTMARAVNNDTLNAEFAAAGYVVLSIDYHYAPEHPFETLIEECTTALRWALRNCETEFGTSNVFLNGDSAGAHLSLCAAQRLKDEPQYGRLRAMVLRYGCYDLSATPSVRDASSDVLVFYGPSLRQFFERITGRSDETARRDPKISPLYGDFESLPPALLVVGTADPLIDDSRLVSHAMRKAGTDHEFILVPEAPHSFDRFPTPVAEKFNAYARAWIAQHLPSARRTEH